MLIVRTWIDGLRRVRPPRAVLLAGAVIVAAACGETGVSDPEPVATALVIVSEPSEITSGSPFDPAVRVLVVDAEGRGVSGASSQVSLSILPGTGAPGAALDGVVARAAVGGTARFDDVTVLGVGTGFRLLASANGLQSDTSIVFDVEPRLTGALEFRVGPSSIAVGDVMTPAVEVALLDGDGNVVEGGDAEVVLSATDGTGDPDGLLEGDVRIFAVDGIARFPALTVSREGSDYTLTAFTEVSPGVTRTAESAVFDVTAWAGAASTVSLQSSAGDFIGQGQDYTYDQTDAVVSGSSDPGSNRFTLRVVGDEYWDGVFQMVDGGPLRPGTFAVPAEADVDWYGEGRGCNSTSGSLTVDSVTYVGEVLTRLTLDFEQFCDGSAAPLTGTFHYDHHDTTRPPGPVVPVPGGLWEPAGDFVPPAGSYVYLASEDGDFIGAGDTLTYTPADVAFDGSLAGGRLSFSVGPWTGTYQPMNSITELEVGYYPDLQRYPGNPAKGGLSWTGAGRGCNRLTGWFAVDELTADGDRPGTLHLRFEQYCDGSPAALRGVIHLEAGWG